MTPERSEYLSPYDRREAVLDGLLLDITATAELENLRYPTAISRRAYSELVRQHCAHTGEDERTRLHQVCDLLRAASVHQRAFLPLVRACVPTYDSPHHAYFAEVWMLLELTEDGERRWTVYLREEA